MQAQTMRNQDEILTLQEVAAYLKLTDKSIYRLAQSGRIPAFKAGGAWRFKRSDIEDWIEANKNQSNQNQGDGDGQA